MWLLIRFPRIPALAEYNLICLLIVLIFLLNRKIQIKYNRGGEIKTEMVPRYTMLTNHCGRRTLITTLVNHGFDYKDIMVVSSHVTLKSFEAYIKKNKVGAAKKMLKQFNERLSILPPITPTNNP